MTARQKQAKDGEPVLIGWRERVSLPALGVGTFTARYLVIAGTSVGSVVARAQNDAVAAITAINGVVAFTAIKRIVAVTAV